MKTKQQLLQEMANLEEKLTKKKQEIEKLEEAERQQLEDDICKVVFAWQKDKDLTNDKLIAALKKALKDPKNEPVRSEKTRAVKRKAAELPKEETKKITKETYVKVKKLAPSIADEDILPVLLAIAASDNEIVSELQLRFHLKDKASAYQEEVKKSFKALKVIADTI